MIAQATQTASHASHTASAPHSAPADERTTAKARMRAAAAKPRPAPTSMLKDFDHNTVVAFIKRHPLATAAGVGAAATIVGPIRLVRVGMAAFRTVSLAAGVVTFLGSLGVPEAEEAVEAAMPHSKQNMQRKRTAARRAGTTSKPAATRKKARRPT